MAIIAPYHDNIEEVPGLELFGNDKKNLKSPVPEGYPRKIFMALKKTIFSPKSLAGYVKQGIIKGNWFTGTEANGIANFIASEIVFEEENEIRDCADQVLVIGINDKGSVFRPNPLKPVESITSGDAAEAFDKIMKEIGIAFVKKHFKIPQGTSFEKLGNISHFFRRLHPTKYAIFNPYGFKIHKFIELKPGKEDLEEQPRFKSHIKFYTPFMTDNSEDLIQTVPAPTKEEGADNQVEWKDLDDKDVKDPDNTEITINIDDDREQRYVDGDPDKVPSNTIITGVENARLWVTSNGLDVTYMPNDLRSIMNFLDTCDRTIANYHNHILGQESFLGYTKAAITGLGNIIGHVLGLFKTGLFYGWRDFKRSELADWCASNYFSKLRINRIPYEPLKEYLIDIPQGMKGKYINAVKVIEKFLNAANMPDLSDRMVSTVEAIWKDLSATNPQMTYFVPVDKKARTAYFNPDILTIFDESSKIFTTNVKLQDAPFKNVFSNMAEFSETVETAIDLDAHLRMVASVHDNLAEIEKVVSKIVTKKDRVSDQQLEVLVDMVRTWANYFDCYATVCNDLNRVDHNLVLILSKWKQYLLDQ